MELLAHNAGKEIWLQELTRPFSLQPSFDGRRYVAIVFCFNAAVTPAERHALHLSLVASGCRYGVFAGIDCDAGEWSMDSAYLESDPDYNPSDAEFTMTSSHKVEPIGEIIYWGLMNTNFDNHDFNRFLVLAIGRSPEIRPEIIKGIQAVWPNAEGN